MIGETFPSIVRRKQHHLQNWISVQERSSLFSPRPNGSPPSSLRPLPLFRRRPSCPPHGPPSDGRIHPVRGPAAAPFLCGASRSPCYLSVVSCGVFVLRAFRVFVAAFNFCRFLAFPITVSNCVFVPSVLGAPSAFFSRDRADLEGIFAFLGFFLFVGGGASILKVPSLFVSAGVCFESLSPFCFFEFLFLVSCLSAISCFPEASLMTCFKRLEFTTANLILS